MWDTAIVEAVSTVMNTVEASNQALVEGPGQKQGSSVGHQGGGGGGTFNKWHTSFWIDLSVEQWQCPLLLTFFLFFLLLCLP